MDSVVSVVTKLEWTQLEKWCMISTMGGDFFPATVSICNGSGA
jgi:hypothetical protein